MIKEMHEYIVTNQTHRKGSAASKSDYDDVFSFTPVQLMTDIESNYLLYFNWDKFEQIRNSIKVILLAKVNDLVSVYNNAGFEVKNLQPVLSSILQEAMNISVLLDFESVTIESSVPFVDTKIYVSGSPYSYNGIGDLSVVVTDSGVRVVFSGIEGKRGGKFFLAHQTRMFSADAFKACAQCASQILGFVSVYERMYGACSVFMQIVSNGREWILVCSRREGYLQRRYTHTQPVSLFSLDSSGKTATALPESDNAYTEVAHAIALMMDCTCYLLCDRKIQTIGAELSKTRISGHFDEEGGEGDAKGLGATGRGFPPPSQSGAKRGSAKKGDNEKGTKSKGTKSVSARTNASEDVANYQHGYGLTEKNMTTHNLHFGLPRGGQSVY